MGSITAITRMRAANRFEDLLPNSPDPAKAQIKTKIVALLNSQGEIVPAAKSPLGRVWRLVNSQNSSLDECEEVIQLDPALTSRIFRVANSAAYNAKASQCFGSDPLYRFQARAGTGGLTPGSSSNFPA